MNEYFIGYMARYINASPETRKASKEHWKQIFTAAFQNNDEHMIEFSAKHLAIIAIMED